MLYRNLHADLINERIARLKNRIEERFPDRNIVTVCNELLTISHESGNQAKAISRPLYWVRLGLPIAIVTFLLAIAGLYLFFQGQIDPSAPLNYADFLGMSDAVFNLAVLFLAFLFFLTSLEQRIKRTRTLKALHQLRSLAHVIDMHQLTKDPERILGQGRHTASSPKDSMTLFEMTRYLNYCSEMLSLTGKLAALYVQAFEDEVAITAVNDLESLTTGLSRKIWQKIMYVHSIDESLGEPLAEEKKGMIFNTKPNKPELDQSNSIQVDAQETDDEQLPLE
ncbi:MAG: hypothetical protein ACI85U_002462 [Candidatus Promineifilaceae bacterium]|jgi:hypothetical protein